MKITRILFVNLVSTLFMAETYAQISIVNPRTDYVEAVAERGKPVSRSKDIRIIGADKGRTAPAVGSGEYDFSIKTE